MFELGSSLRETRVRRGLELAQIAAETRIRTRYLQAIEEERFERLPGSVYAKGFLRSYADYLDLDSQLFVDEYQARFGTKEEVLPVPAQLELRPRSLRPYGLAGIVLLLALGGAVLAWQLHGTPSRPAGPQAAPVAAASAPASAVAPHPPPVGRAGSETGAALVLRATRGPCWLSVPGGASTADRSSKGCSSRASPAASASGGSGCGSARPGTWSPAGVGTCSRCRKRLRACS